MIRPTVATVHLEAIQHNLGVIRALVLTSSRADAHSSTAAQQHSSTPAPSVIAVVKANAYGHGAGHVAQALEAAGASMFACADLEEGVALRQAGIERPILVFGALSVSDLSYVFEHALTPTVSTPSAARALEAAAARRDQVIACHLKIDTGMNRLGFRHDNLQRTLPPVLAAPHLRIEAVYTHFATADHPESPWLDEQRRRFDVATAALGAMGLRQIRRHAANSAALLRDARTWYDAVRPGLLLYGIVPPPLAATNLELRPALSLTSRIVAVKGLRSGEGTGYGLKWQEDRPRTIAIVPAGYADGLDIRLAGRGQVLVRGKRRQIVGAMNMDMMMIDVTGEDVSPGDEVVMIGRQGAEEITAREIASTIGSIPWEVICRLGSRIERVY
ncbi:MAG TPA: alanine racemase [Vicinamibacterales bacterium]|nr:alanine racemase [Vicinamibacterales bacterium]